LERSFGGAILLQELRRFGVKVEPHSARFRHDTKDEHWLAFVGKQKWIVLMRDQTIGRRPLELEALLNAGVKSFVLVQGQLPDSENARIIIGALPKILRMIADNNFPFIARIAQSGKNSSVTMWKTRKNTVQNRRRGK
jgi:hypothetical protein